MNLSGAYAVQRTTGIGSTGVLVSDKTGPTRRTVRNIGTVACELVPTLGAAYGTGHPLPVGESFTFDDDGLMNGPIYVAAASAGGSVSVLSY